MIGPQESAVKSFPLNQMEEGGAEPARMPAHQTCGLNYPTAQIRTNQNKSQQIITLSGISTLPALHKSALIRTNRNNLTGTIPGLPIQPRFGSCGFTKSNCVAAKEKEMGINEDLESREITVSLRFLAKRWHWSHRKVRRWLEDLEKHGYLKLVFHEGSSLRKTSVTVSLGKEKGVPSFF